MSALPQCPWVNLYGDIPGIEEGQTRHPFFSLGAQASSCRTVVAIPGRNTRPFTGVINRQRENKDTRHQQAHQQLHRARARTGRHPSSTTAQGGKVSLLPSSSPWPNLGASPTAGRNELVERNLVPGGDIGDVVGEIVPAGGHVGQGGGGCWCRRAGDALDDRHGFVRT